MAGPGFKVADGYVEVHARYDKGELRRAAEGAADDTDTAFNRERERNASSGSTRSINRNIGRSAGRDIVAGAKESVDKDRDSNVFQRWIAKHRPVFKAGGATSASAFGRGFIEAITFGQADIGMGAAGKLAPQFAKAGSAVGAVFAGLFITTVAAAITAATPLLLAGIIAAIPMISLIKSGVKKEDGKWVFQANEMGKALKKLSLAWKDFKAVVSAPFKAPLIEILSLAGDSLRRLAGPWSQLVQAISPGVVALFKGVFGAIEAFVTAIGPAMPGVTAGLQEWGRQLPIIGKAVGEFFTAIMKNPAQVQAAIKGISQLLQDVLKLLGFLIPALTFAFNLWQKWGNGFRVGQMAGQAFITWARAAFTSFKAWFSSVWAGMKTAFSSAWNSLKSTASAVWAAIRGAVSRGIAAVRAVLSSALNAIVTLWKRVWNSQIPSTLRNALGIVKDIWKLAAAAIRSVIGTLLSWAKSAWTKGWNAVKSATSSAWKAIKSAVTSAINAIKALFGPAMSAIRSRVVSGWNAIKSATSSAWNAVKAVVRAAWSALSSAVSSGVNKVVSLVRSLKSRVVGALSGAGGWLVSAGRQIIQGLLNGINSMIGAVRDKLSSLTALIKASKGPPEKDKVLLYESGQLLMGGLMKGIDSKTGALQSQLGGLTAKIPAMAGGGSTVSNTNSWNPTIVVNVAAGLDPVNAAARRALTRDLFLELERYRKDYVK